MDMESIIKRCREMKKTIDTILSQQYTYEFYMDKFKSFPSKLLLQLIDDRDCVNIDIVGFSKIGDIETINRKKEIYNRLIDGILKILLDRCDENGNI